MSAEPLVMIPPMLCDARVFAAQMIDLSRDTTVMFAPTTTGERIEEIASHILTQMPNRFALAGMGMGGVVAMELMRRAPEKITRIALMNTTPQADTPDVAAMREPLIVAARSGRYNDAIRAEMNPAWLAPGPARFTVAALVSEMAQALGPNAYVRQARAMQRRRDMQVVLRKIKQPALVMCGEADGVNPVRRHEFMAELIPYAKLEIIADAGHLPSLEQPEAVTEVLREWLRQPLVLR